MIINRINSIMGGTQSGQQGIGDTGFQIVGQGQQQQPNFRIPAKQRVQQTKKPTPLQDQKPPSGKAQQSQKKKQQKPSKQQQQKSSAVQDQKLPSGKAQQSQKKKKTKKAKPIDHLVDKYLQQARRTGARKT